jgi:hypothetical protein
MRRFIKRYIFYPCGISLCYLRDLLRADGVALHWHSFTDSCSPSVCWVLSGEHLKFLVWPGLGWTCDLLLASRLSFKFKSRFHEDMFHVCILLHSFQISTWTNWSQILKIILNMRVFFRKCAKSFLNWTMEEMKALWPTLKSIFKDVMSTKMWRADSRYMHCFINLIFLKKSVS